MQRTVARRIGQHFADCNSSNWRNLSKPPHLVLALMMQPCKVAPRLKRSFCVIANVVERKQYRLEWREQRNAFTRNDLEWHSADEKIAPELKEQITPLLRDN